MNFVFGLGNPGKEYAQTRHNVGFMVVDALQEVLPIGTSENGKKFFSEVYKTNNTLLVKPQTFMNDSGRAARAVLQFFDKNLLQPDAELRNVFVIHDDLDIEVGAFKIQFGTGPKIHNGLNSMYEHLGTDQFWHVRIGVDGRQGARAVPSQEYVLSPFVGEEANKIHAVIEAVVKELLSRL